MAKYKCIVSGNVIEFTNQVDIDSMVGHAGYELLVEEPKEAVKAPVKKAAAKVQATATEAE